MAWSPYKQAVVEFVRQHPGCTKKDVARHVTFHKSRDVSKQYYIVNTAIRNGWIVATRVGGRYSLTVPQSAI